MAQKHTESDNRCTLNVTGSATRVSGPETKGRLTPRIVARFWAKVNRQEGGCWLWTAGTSRDGYGMFHVGRDLDGRQDVRYAHRTAYALMTGSVPAGLVVCHSCDTPRCVNPDHLFLGTQGDNVRDGARKQRYHVEHPGRWVIPADLRQRLIQTALVSPRGTTTRLAREHGLSPQLLYMAVRRARHRQQRDAVRQKVLA